MKDLFETIGAVAKAHAESVRTDLNVQPQVSETYHLNIHLLDALLDRAFTYGARYQVGVELGLKQSADEAKREARNEIHTLLD